MRPSRSWLTRVIPALVVVALLGAACTQGSDAPADPDRSASETAAARFPLTLVDDDGVEVTIAAEPQRIVTFAPSMTEIVYALGLGDRLVGVSGPFDDFPAEAQQVEQVGGAGDFGVDPNVERVVALEPDLLLTISGGDAWKAELRDLGVPVVTLNATDFGDLLDDILTVGEPDRRGRGCSVARGRHVRTRAGGRGAGNRARHLLLRGVLPAAHDGRPEHLRVRPPRRWPAATR